MRWGGIAIALFVAFHLLNLTTGTVHTHFVQANAYMNVVRDFKLWYIVVIYLVALFALGMHLYHGLWSSLQTLGRNRPQRDETYRRVSKTLAIVTILGYVAVPLAVIVGLVS
jgi:succinate dehydrogenase / fumarate reductase cytochrome b subunit